MIFWITMKATNPQTVLFILELDELAASTFVCFDQEIVYG